MLGKSIATLPKMAFMRRRQIMFLLLLLVCFALFQNIYESKLLTSSVIGDESDAPFLMKSIQRLKISISKTSIHLHIHDGNDSKVLEAVIGENIRTPLQPRIVKDYEEIFEIDFGSSTSLRLKFYKLGNETDCYKVFWTTNVSNNRDYDSHQDRVNVGDSYWFGGALMHESYWPLNGKSHSLAPFVTGNSYHNDYGSIQERFWLSSTGSSIFIQYDVPLFVDINHSTPGWLTLVSSYKKPYRSTASTLLHLNYTLCSCESKHPKQMFQAAAGIFWKYPLATPNENLFRYPTWSTWAAFKRSISSDVLISFANKIVSHGLKCSQIIIDDGWMTHYGDFKFNSDLFPDPRGLVTELRKILNASVSLWVHPFSTCLSRNFWKRDSDGESLWVRSYFDWLPSQIIWWNGLGSLLDLTNDEAFDWYLLELEILQKQYGIDSFKFDAGESTWLPSNGAVKGDLSNPNVYTRLFSEIAYRSDIDGSRSQEVRSLVSSQALPIFARLIDKNSDWGEDNGIRSIIPQTLTMGVIGYPFVFPDMIGGNGYFGIFIHFTVLPERELYIRWLELSALMPAMQFSIPPWSYDEEVVQIARAMSEVHLNFSNLIISLAQEAVKTGAPIIRPMWWLYEGQNGICSTLKSHEKDILTSDTQFLLGDDVVVAPILEKGARKRKVYLPHGNWTRAGLEGRYTGDTWHEIEVPLNQLAYFVRSS